MQFSKMAVLLTHITYYFSTYLVRLTTVDLTVITYYSTLHTSYICNFFNTGYFNFSYYLRMVILQNYISNRNTHYMLNVISSFFISFTVYVVFESHKYIWWPENTHPPPSRIAKRGELRKKNSWSIGTDAIIPAQIQLHILLYYITIVWRLDMRWRSKFGRVEKKKEEEIWEIWGE